MAKRKANIEISMPNGIGSNVSIKINGQEIAHHCRSFNLEMDAGTMMLPVLSLVLVDASIEIDGQVEINSDETIH